jgi:hypothetical protein
MGGDAALRKLRFKPQISRIDTDRRRTAKALIWENLRNLRLHSFSLIYPAQPYLPKRAKPKKPRFGARAFLSLASP